MKKKTLTLFMLCWCFSQFAEGQMINTGQDVAIATDALITVNGDYINQAGSVLDSGVLVVYGNWINNDEHSNVFDLRSAGVVDFAGADQDMGGSNKTIFPSVILSGSGNKTLSVSMDVLNKLDLTDNELKVSDYNLSMLSPKEDAIARTSGFISTSAKGKLIRNISEQGSYLFPLGSSTLNLSGFGTAVYRPLEVNNENAAPNVFSAALIANDPTNVGYNRNLKRKDVSSVYDKYFYLLNQETGSSNVQVKFFRNSVEDGKFNQLVCWDNYGLWEKAAPSTNTNGSFKDNLDRYLLFKSAQRFNSLPVSFADLSSDSVTDPLTIFNAFSPDGDGKNDTWIIKNIDLYPNNSISIFNRWGDEVYKTTSYSSSNVWDGGTLNPGTYYYILQVEINGQMKTYKGFITMVKKK